MRIIEMQFTRPVAQEMATLGLSESIWMSAKKGYYLSKPSFRLAAAFAYLV